MERNAPSVIYAIEEPETSQHPTSQRLVVEALLELAETPGSQVLLTTHVHGLAGLLPRDSLRHVHRSGQTTSVYYGSDDILHTVARELGVSPDRRVEIVVFVEGPGDVAFLVRVSEILAGNPKVAALKDNPRVAIIPVGGSNLKQWVEQHYLKGLSLPEIHIYDRDADNPPKYQHVIDAVNNRGDGSWGVLTSKRGIEKYLHPGAIKEVLSVSVAFGDMDDVGLLTAQAIHTRAPDGRPWEELEAERIRGKVKRAKYRICRDVVSRMSRRHIQAMDPAGEIEGCLQRIQSMLSGPHYLSNSDTGIGSGDKVRL